MSTSKTFSHLFSCFDTGDPPMTGTATLNIHVQDQNDNSPILNATAIGMCASDSTSEADISAHDLDGDPFGGPFTFKLLEDHKGWTLDPEHGKVTEIVLLV